MASKTLSVSITDEQMGFLDDNPTLSPSHLLQGTIENIKNTLKSNPQLIEANKTITRLGKVIDRIQEDLLKSTDFINSKGLWEEFIKNNQKNL